MNVWPRNNMLLHYYEDSPNQYDPSRSVFSKSSFFGSIGSCGVGSVWTERIRKRGKDEGMDRRYFRTHHERQKASIASTSAFEPSTAKINPHLHMLLDQAAVKQSLWRRKRLSNSGTIDIAISSPSQDSQTDCERHRWSSRRSRHAAPASPGTRCLLDPAGS